MEFNFPEYLTTYSNILDLLQAQYDKSQDTIQGQEADAPTFLLDQAFQDELSPALETLRQAFADYQLPLLTSVTEDMYDALAALERLHRTASFDRDFYYAKAPDEYQKYSDRLDILRAMLERYEEEHRVVFE
jgi:hypothetical protein